MKSYSNWNIYDVLNYVIPERELTTVPVLNDDSLNKLKKNWNNINRYALEIDWKRLSEIREKVKFENTIENWNLSMRDTSVNAYPYNLLLNETNESYRLRSLLFSLNDLEGKDISQLSDNRRSWIPSIEMAPPGSNSSDWWKDELLTVNWLKEGWRQSLYLATHIGVTDNFKKQMESYLNKILLQDNKKDIFDFVKECGEERLKYEFKDEKLKKKIQGVVKNELDSHSFEANKTLFVGSIYLFEESIDPIKRVEALLTKDEYDPMNFFEEFGHCFAGLSDSNKERLLTLMQKKWNRAQLKEYLTRAQNKKDHTPLEKSFLEKLSKDKGFSPLVEKTRCAKDIQKWIDNLKERYPHVGSKKILKEYSSLNEATKKYEDINRVLNHAMYIAIYDNWLDIKPESIILHTQCTNPFCKDFFSSEKDYKELRVGDISCKNYSTLNNWDVEESISDKKGPKVYIQGKDKKQLTSLEFVPVFWQGLTRTISSPVPEEMKKELDLPSNGNNEYVALLTRILEDNRGLKGRSLFAGENLEDLMRYLEEMPKDIEHFSLVSDKKEWNMDDSITRMELTDTNCLTIINKMIKQGEVKEALTFAYTRESIGERAQDVLIKTIYENIGQNNLFRPTNIQNVQDILLYYNGDLPLEINEKGARNLITAAEETINTCPDASKDEISYLLMEKLSNFKYNERGRSEVLAYISDEVESKHKIMSMDSFDHMSKAADKMGNRQLAEIMSQTTLLQLFNAGVRPDDIKSYLLQGRNDLLSKQMESDLKPGRESLYARWKNEQEADIANLRADMDVLKGLISSYSPSPFTKDER